MIQSLNNNVISLSEPVFRGNEWRYIKDCLDSGWVSSVGKYVDLFEQKVAEYVGSRYAVSTVNGTAAIHTALMVAGVSQGDVVVVPTLSFIATVNPVVYCGAIPVFVDSEKETLNVDPRKAMNTIRQLTKDGRKPKAIIVTHLYGHPCDMDPVLDIAREYGVLVIEDACESLGSRYKGKMTGTLGDIGCFSFNGNKIVTTAGGGMLLTNHESLAMRAKYLTTQARDDENEYVHNEIGYNYRLTNIQAALGLAQLEQLSDFIQEKRRIAQQYHKELGNVEGVRLLCEQEWAQSNYWLNSILIKRDHFNRRHFLEKVDNDGIQLRPLFKPLHMQRPFASTNSDEFEEAESLYETGFNLPSSVSLSDGYIKKVAHSVKATLAKI
jgi:perosamine synthetase